jgi:hypothetical protein
MTDMPAGFEDVWSADRTRQNAAYAALMAATATPVPWAGEVWDDPRGSGRIDHGYPG